MHLRETISLLIANRFGLSLNKSKRAIRRWQLTCNSELHRYSRDRRNSSFDIDEIARNRRRDVAAPK